MRKRFERGFKSVVHDSYAISVAPPKLYSQRFADFMCKEVGQWAWVGPAMNYSCARRWGGGAMGKAKQGRAWYRA